MLRIHSVRTCRQNLIDAILALTLEVSCACAERKRVTEAVFTEIVGSKQVRKGPRPSADSESSMLRVIGHYVDQGLPIPFMVPWGSEKPDGGTIDIAEYCALKTMWCLHRRVQTHYNPGIVCHVRMEDASAPHLFFERADAARQEARVYCDAFERLVEVLDIASAVKVRRESAMVSESVFNAMADSIVPFMEQHLLDLDSEARYRELAEHGWKGPVSRLTIGEYMGRYAHLYPTKNERERLHILARYLSAALARKKLGIRGDDPSWNGGFLDLSFVEASRTSGYSFPNRVYYRTIPEGVSSYHLPAWRAKGHLVFEGGGARPRLAPFKEALDLEPGELVLEREGTAVRMRCDWKG